MSFKAKDLQFDSSQPAFLQRLRGQLAGDGSGRHERQVPRNIKKKENEEDDAPTYVLEDSSQTLTKEEYDALVLGDNAQGEKEPSIEPDVKDENTEATQKSKQRIAEVGAQVKKRKIAKVIGDQPDEEESDKKSKDVPRQDKAKKPKKKSKAVKLTFGDEGEG